MKVEKHVFAIQAKDLSVAVKALEDTRNQVMGACKETEREAQVEKEKAALLEERLLRQVVDDFKARHESPKMPHNLLFAKILLFVKILNLFKGLTT